MATARNFIGMALAMLLSVAAAASAVPAGAQPSAPARVGADIKPTATVNLHDGIAPGSEGWTRVERTTRFATTGGRAIRNVSTPSVEAYLPDRAKATGLGVVIAPGGGFRFLSYDAEGVWVAQWLADHGVAAFVLKYRLVETPSDDVEAFRRPAPSAIPATPRPPSPLAGAAMGAADGIRAMSVVRQHAAEWGVSPDRIGIMGFSAGANVTVSTVRALASDKPPLFAAPIYGGEFGSDSEPLPARLPPFFLAVSVDDQTAVETSNRLYQQLRAAGQKPEFHVYHSGGHGWGIETRGASHDHWIDEFYWWLQSQGFLTKR